MRTWDQVPLSTTISPQFRASCRVFSSPSDGVANFTPSGAWLASFANIFYPWWCHMFSSFMRYFRWLSALLAFWHSSLLQKRW